jgi:uncharacterized membrane protein YphA (DoxX/SURF4 family)
VTIIGRILRDPTHLVATAVVASRRSCDVAGGQQKADLNVGGTPFPHHRKSTIMSLVLSILLVLGLFTLLGLVALAAVTPVAETMWNHAADRFRFQAPLAESR